MQTWVLIVILTSTSYGNQPAIAMQEFQGHELCDIAKAGVVSASKEVNIRHAECYLSDSKVK
jgi:hypothetical protein